VSRTPISILLREVLGTLLVLGGLGVAGLCAWLLYKGYAVEGIAAVFLSLIVLGLGTHLLKVALAVRVVRDEKAGP